MPSTDDSPTRALRKLLLDLFNAEELRRLIDDYYADIADQLPSNGSTEELAASVVSTLRRFGHIDVSLFSRLEQERPRQLDAIYSCAARWRLAFPTDVANPTTLASAPGRGALLGAYRLLEKIGQGGFGSVWTCESPDRSVVVAKILRPDYSAERELVARFFRGAERMADFADPMFVKILMPRGEDHGLCYYLMEHVDGPSLESAVRERKVAAPRLLQQFVELGRSLGRAHASGKIHRDVKPGNIIVDRQGRLRLTDFDFVGLLDSPLHTLTTTAVSIDYTAPEVFRGAPLDERAEVYSLARTMLFALQGEPSPMLGNPTDSATFPHSLREVLLRGSSRQRDSRYSNMDEFCDALAAALEESRTRPPWLVQRLDMKMRISYRAAASYEDREVPLRILVLGDFFPSDLPIEARRPMRVDRDTIDRALYNAEIALTVKVSVDPMLEVTLRLRSISDFHPDSLIRQHPALEQLSVARNALRALKSPLGNAPVFARNLLAYIRVTDSSARGGGEGLEEFAVRLLDIGRLDPTDESLRLGISELIAQASRRRCQTAAAVSACIDELLRDYDATLSAAVDSILHDPDFMRIEAAWRSLYFLAERLNFEENVYVEFLNASASDLLDDFHDSPPPFRSGLYKLLVSSTYAVFGGWPYALVCFTYSLNLDHDGCELLQHCAETASQAQTLLLIGAKSVVERPHSDDHLTRLWASFRQSEAARYLAICLETFRLRAPYEGPRVRCFQFSETIAEGPLAVPVGTSALALTIRIAESFARHRGYSEIRGSVHLDVPAGGLAGAVSLWHSARMAQLGYILPIFENEGESLGFTYISTSASEKSEDGVMTEHDPSRFQNTLDAMMMGCRFAQYMMIMFREIPGVGTDRDAVTRELGAALRMYVTDVPDPSPAVVVRRPLRAASITLEDRVGDGFRFTLTIAPVVAHGNAGFEISISGRLH